MTSSDAADARIVASSTRTVERALGLLAEVCSQGAVTLSECARRTRLPASTALRLLRTLEATGFVTRDEFGAFRAGGRLVQLGAIVLGQQSIVQYAEPALRRIVAASGESAYLSLAGPGETVLYAAMVEGTHTIRHTSWIGRTVPMDGTAVGIVLRGATPAAGYAVAQDDIESDVTAIAAPIRRPGGYAGALNLIGPTYRLDQDSIDRYGRLVSDEANNLAAKLGVTDTYKARATAAREAGAG